MRFARTSILAFTSLVLTLPASPQQTATPTVQRDPQAIAVMTKTLDAAGGVSALSAIRDFTATGMVSYNWGESPVQGNVTVKGRGLGQFRIDATLPEGGHSWSMDNGGAFEKHSDGTVTPLPFPLKLRPANSTFPFSRLVAVLEDTSWSISSVGTAEFSGQQAYDITVQRIYPDKTDPTGFKSKVTKSDFIIDPKTSLVLSFQDKAYPRDSGPGDAPHEMQFSNYQPFNGILVPCTITELIGGQPTNTFQLSHVTFNSGLTDSDFAMQ